MKSLLPLALVSAVAICAADSTPVPDPNIVRAVMYEFTFKTDTLAITHAQVIGGYQSADLCEGAMPRVSAMGEPLLDPGEEMQLECSTVKMKAHQAPETAEPPQPKTPI